MNKKDASAAEDIVAVIAEAEVTEAVEADTVTEEAATIKEEDTKTTNP